VLHGSGGAGSPERRPASTFISPEKASRDPSSPMYEPALRRRSGPHGDGCHSLACRTDRAWLWVEGAARAREALQAAGAQQSKASVV